MQWVERVQSPLGSGFQTKSIFMFIQRWGIVRCCVFTLTCLTSLGCKCLPSRTEMEMCMIIAAGLHICSLGVEIAHKMYSRLISPFKSV